MDAEESTSLKQLQAVISIMCEYLGLWKILCDHQFHVIAGALNPASLAQISWSSSLLLLSFIGLILLTARDERRHTQQCPKLASTENRLSNQNQETIRSSSSFASLNAPVILLLVCGYVSAISVSEISDSYTNSVCMSNWCWHEGHTNNILLLSFDRCHY